MAEQDQNIKLIREIENQLSRKFAFPVKVKNVVPLGGGCINHASKLVTNAGEFFLKWNDDGPADLFIREAEGLTEMAKITNEFLKIPEVYLVKEINDTPGFLLLEYLSPGYGSGKDEKNLGRGLAKIHLHNNEYFGFFHDNYCGSTPQNNRWEKDWIKFYGENRLLYLLKLISNERQISVGEMNIFERLINQLPGLLPSESHPSLIHGDLWSGNFMMTTIGPALIDPAACYADRELEFGILTLFGGFSNHFREGYNEIFPLIKGWSERNPLYQLYHLLNHYYLFGGGYKTQALIIARHFA